MSFWQIAGIGFVLVILLLAFVRAFTDPEEPRSAAEVHPPPPPAPPSGYHGSDGPPRTGGEPDGEWLPGAGPKNQIVSIIDDLNSADSVSRLFANIFALSADRGEAEIASIMNHRGCGRTEAMRIAINDRRRDETRWD
ncbi:hypothetical protein ELH43_36800 [Rhizobium ruizarguesonis]|uniref:hypothetical protein n=1 Tax=Rhizobium ruizarguesonis TaxID=2081791 RepID=UPI00102FBE8F|nr:hypothetical protein [Rhizobium ruizarguesonis]TBB60699.1 hypothetical protein ELH43_36800 [Rhizobium ruizarguesonis]